MIISRYLPFIKSLDKYSTEIIIKIILSISLYIAATAILKESEILVVFLVSVCFIFLVLNIQTFPILSALVFLVPFQPIDSGFGSINMFLVYFLSGVVITKKIIRKEKLKEKTVADLPFLFILLAYILSLANINSGLKPHLMYLFAFISNILIFYLIVSSVKTEKELYTLVYIMGFSSILVFLYCYLQMFALGSHINVLGFEELRLREASHQLYGLNRVRGPFANAEIMCEYAVIQSLIQIFMFFHEKKTLKEYFWMTLLILNITVLIATSTRAGIICETIGLIYFAFIFRKRFHLRKFLMVVPLIILIFYLGSIFLHTYTRSGYLFERLGSTEIKAGSVIKNRGNWFLVFPYLKEHLFIGHGPRYDTPSNNLNYPHSLYIFLVYTMGLFGLISFLWLFLELFKYSWKGLKLPNSNLFLWGMVAIFQIILVIFLIDEIKIEFLRWPDRNYQHFIFFLFGLLVAAVNMVRADRARIMTEMNK